MVRLNYSSFKALYSCGVIMSLFYGVCYGIGDDEEGVSSSGSHKRSAEESVEDVPVSKKQKEELEDPIIFDEHEDHVIVRDGQGRELKYNFGNTNLFSVSGMAYHSSDSAGLWHCAKVLYLSLVPHLPKIANRQDYKILKQSKCIKFKNDLNLLGPKKVYFYLLFNFEQNLIVKISKPEVDGNGYLVVHPSTIIPYFINNDEVNKKWKIDRVFLKDFNNDLLKTDDEKTFYVRRAQFENADPVLSLQMDGLEGGQGVNLGCQLDGELWHDQKLEELFKDPSLLMGSNLCFSISGSPQKLIINQNNIQNKVIDEPILVSCPEQLFLYCQKNSDIKIDEKSIECWDRVEGDDHWKCIFFAYSVPNKGDQEKKCIFYNKNTQEMYVIDVPDDVVDKNSIEFFPNALYKEGMSEKCLFLKLLFIDFKLSKIKHLKFSRDINQKSYQFPPFPQIEIFKLQEQLTPNNRLNSLYLTDSTHKKRIFLEHYINKKQYPYFKVFIYIDRFVENPFHNSFFLNAAVPDTLLTICKSVSVDKESNVLHVSEFPILSKINSDKNIFYSFKNNLCISNNNIRNFYRSDYNPFFLIPAKLNPENINIYSIKRAQKEFQEANITDYDTQKILFLMRKKVNFTNQQLTCISRGTLDRGDEIVYQFTFKEPFDTIRILEHVIDAITSCFDIKFKKAEIYVPAIPELTLEELKARCFDLDTNIFATIIKADKVTAKKSQVHSVAIRKILNPFLGYLMNKPIGQFTTEEVEYICQVIRPEVFKKLKNKKDKTFSEITSWFYDELTFTKKFVEMLRNRKDFPFYNPESKIGGFVKFTDFIDNRNFTIDKETYEVSLNSINNN